MAGMGAFNRVAEKALGRPLSSMGQPTSPVRKPGEPIRTILPEPASVGASADTAELKRRRRANASNSILGADEETLGGP